MSRDFSTCFTVRAHLGFHLGVSEVKKDMWSNEGQGQETGRADTSDDNLALKSGVYFFALLPPLM